RTTILISSIAGVISAPFWGKVYDNHGVWGVVFSLRNENIYELFFDSGFRTYFLDWVLGGQGRFPNNKVEMMLFDALAYFGVLGLFIYILFLLKIISNWTWCIPLIVACFAGGIYEAPLVMVLYVVLLLGIKKKIRLIHSE
ncbi:MAG: hypothetical protein ACPH3F_04835, partial [Flavobacteriaceae bacterium]